jgi:hypothetical protein
VLRPPPSSRHQLPQEEVRPHRRGAYVQLISA